MNIKNFFLKYKVYFTLFFNMVFLLVLIEVLGGVNGVLGFVGFTIAIAVFRLWTMRRAYFDVCSYGATMLEVKQKWNKESKGDKNEKNEQKRRNKKTKPTN